jgi:hypothetical protein
MDLLTILRLAPWAIAALAIGFGLFQQSNYEGCKAARAGDAAAANEAKATALQEAQKKADAIITEQAQKLAETAVKAQTVTERIIRVPVTTACAGSPAVHDALSSLPDILNSGGGKTTAGSGASPTVH